MSNISIPDYAKHLPYKEILNAQDHYGIGWELLSSICYTESSGNQYALRYEPNFKYLHDINRLSNLLKCPTQTAEAIQKFSYGYCQIMGATAIDLGILQEDDKFPWPTLLFRSDINFKYACLLLNKKIEKYGENFDDVYAAYNAGIVSKDKNGIYRNEWAVIKFRKYFADFKGEGGIRMVKLYV
jgi:hypothetical protein